MRCPENGKKYHINYVKIVKILLESVWRQINKIELIDHDTPRPINPAVAFGCLWGVLARPMYLLQPKVAQFSRAHVSQNHVRKKTAFLHTNLPRTATKSARQSDIICAISLTICSKKLREFLHFPLKSFRVPRAYF